MARARQLRRFSLLLLLLAFSPEGTLGAALAKAKPKKAKAKKKPAASSGGGFGAVAPKAAKASVLQPPQWKQAVQAKGAMLVAKPEDPQLWLEMGALLVKGREYAEAERVFRLGAITHPDFEYLSAAALTMGGDSEAYWHGQAVPLKPGPRVDAAAFDSFDAPTEVLDTWDQVCSALTLSLPLTLTLTLTLTRTLTLNQTLTLTLTLHRRTGPSSGRRVRRVRASCTARARRCSLWRTAPGRSRRPRRTRRPTAAGRQEGTWRRPPPTCR